MQRHPNCLHCVYWCRETTNSGHCHRYPPAVTSNGHTGTLIQQFPVTSQFQWCGEWSNDASAMDGLVERCMTTTVGAA